MVQVAPKRFVDEGRKGMQEDGNVSPKSQPKSCKFKGLGVFLAPLGCVLGGSWKVLGGVQGAFGRVWMGFGIKMACRDDLGSHFESFWRPWGSHWEAYGRQQATKNWEK